MKRLIKTTCIAVIAVCSTGAFAQDLDSTDPSEWFEDPEDEFRLTWAGDCPGRVTLTVGPSFPGERVAFAYSASLGATPTPTCAGVSLEIESARLITFRTVGEDGYASVSGFAPTGACGNTFAQAVNLDGCVLSNRVLVGSGKVELNVHAPRATNSKDSAGPNERSASRSTRGAAPADSEAARTTAALSDTHE